jgi:glycosyltransferase involved in cell wall biosynthesis
VGPRVAAVVEQSWHRVPGGTATSTIRTLDAVARYTDVELVGLAARHREPAPTDLAPTIPVEHLPLSRLALYEAWHRLRRPAVTRWTGPIDVVHATGGVMPPRSGAALVATIHDLAFLHRPEQFTKRGVSFMTRSLELAKVEADLVIVPSEATAKDCRHAGIEQGQLRVIPWGCEPVVIAESDRENVRAAYSLPEEFVLWVGTAEPRKNLPSLLEAHQSAHADLPLILVGPVGWGNQAMYGTPGGTDRVRHLGVVPDSVLSVLYELATIFVYPSLMEGFGMPVLEAMAQGTPVITSRGSATEEVAGGAARLIDPLDSGSIATAIDEIASDAVLRDKLSAKARFRAAALTWENTASLTASVYREVVR